MVMNANSDINANEKWTIAQIWGMTGYGTTATTYQMLRKKGVHPVSKRPNPSGQGGDIGEYDPEQVLAALGHRIRVHQLKTKAEAQK